MSKPDTSCRGKSHRKQALFALAKITGIERFQHWLKSHLKLPSTLPYMPEYVDLTGLVRGIHLIFQVC